MFQRGVLAAAAFAAGLLCAPPSFSQTVPYTGTFTGDLGVYAVTVDPDATTFTVLSSVSYMPDDAFPLASSFKPILLLETLRRVDAGEIGLKDVVDIPAAWHSLDGGRLPSRARVKKLAKNMIRSSHNTSTDTLFKLVGLGAPTATLEAWGLGGMRIVMPTREFWLALSGLVPDHFPLPSLPTAAAAFAAGDRASQVAAVEALQAAGAAIDVDTLDVALDDFYEFDTHNRATAFAILDDVDNLATPRQMVEFYWHLFFDSGLSAESASFLRKTMRRGDGAIDRRSIRVPLRAWGGKGGDDLGMGSVAGYGETRAGNHVIYAIMGRHMTNEDRDWTIIEDLIAWVFDTLDAS
jgi:beta-lactamase class A